MDVPRGFFHEERYEQCERRGNSIPQAGLYHGLYVSVIGASIRKEHFATAETLRVYATRDPVQLIATAKYCIINTTNRVVLPRSTA